MFLRQCFILIFSWILFIGNAQAKTQDKTPTTTFYPSNLITKLPNRTIKIKSDSAGTTYKIFYKKSVFFLVVSHDHQFILPRALGVPYQTKELDKFKNPLYIWNCDNKICFTIAFTAENGYNILILNQTTKEKTSVTEEFLSSLMTGEL